jgi:hypothetical protein
VTFDPEMYGRHAAEAKYGIVPASAVEPKTKAAGYGAGAGGVVATFVLWALDAAFWNGDAAPDVPLPVAALVMLAIPAAVAFGASYMARHVNRLPLA